MAFEDTRATPMPPARYESTSTRSSAEAQRRTVERLSYTIEEAAEALAMTRSLLYKEISSGSLKTYTIGRRRFIRADAIRAWLDELSASEASTPKGATGVQHTRTRGANIRQITSSSRTG